MATGPAYFEIHVDDPERAMGFYRDAFGWIFTKANREPVEYWHIDTGVGQGGMLRRPSGQPMPLSGVNAFVCSMVVEDYDSMAAELLTHGARVVFPKFAVPGLCWQGYFSDTEGNTFGIFEPDVEARRQEPGA